MPYGATPSTATAVAARLASRPCATASCQRAITAAVLAAREMRMPASISLPPVTGDRTRMASG